MKLKLVIMIYLSSYIYMKQVHTSAIVYMGCIQLCDIIYLTVIYNYLNI